MGVPIARRRPHVAGQRAAHAPAGAETSGATPHPLPRPAPPVCQAHDKKIFPAKAEIPNHQQVVIWDFCFYYGSINQISESGLLNLYAGIDLSEK